MIIYLWNNSFQFLSCLLSCVAILLALGLSSQSVGGGCGGRFRLGALWDASGDPTALPPI